MRVAFARIALYADDCSQVVQCGSYGVGKVQGLQNFKKGRLKVVKLRHAGIDESQKFLAVLVLFRDVLLELFLVRYYRFHCKLAPVRLFSTIYVAGVSVIRSVERTA